MGRGVLRARCGGAARPAGGRLGKTPGPGGGPGLIREGEDAAATISVEQRRSTSRRDLQQRHATFSVLSPETGTLDLDALDGIVGADVDEALALVADAAGATDPRLRALARAAAARLVLDVVVAAGPRGRGAAHLRTARLPETGGDIDLEASMEAVLGARMVGSAPDARDLRGRVWQRPEIGLCLLVDRSGSMGGARLATAAVAASAAALRSGADLSVIAFAEDAVVVKGQLADVASAVVVERLLALRGHGPTDLALGLRAARLQLDASRAGRKIAIVLSDCRATAGEDPMHEARLLPELAVLAPADDDEDAREFASVLGARLAVVAGPSSVPRAFAALFER